MSTLDKGMGKAWWEAVAEDWRCLQVAWQSDDERAASVALARLAKSIDRLQRYVNTSSSSSMTARLTDYQIDKLERIFTRDRCDEDQIEQWAPTVLKAIAELRTLRLNVGSRGDGE